MSRQVALVLSGGGARGIAHIGAIEELEQQGFHIHSIAGTSMGSLIGGVYAAGKMKEYKEWIYTLDRQKVLNLIDFTLSTQGLIKGDKVFARMKKFIPDTNIEDLNIDFAAVAADIIHHKEVVFRTGSMYDAIRASIAIPSVFTPVKTNGTVLVDGGVMNNIPINHVKRVDRDILVVVYVNADIPVEKPVVTAQEEKRNRKVYLEKIKEFQQHLYKVEPKHKTEKLGFFNLIDKTISTMTYQLGRLMLEQYSPDIMIEVSRYTCNTFDFYKAEELVETGRNAAQKSIARYLKSLPTLSQGGNLEETIINPKI